MSKVPLHQIASVLAEKTFSAQEIAAYLLATGRTGDLNSIAREMILDRASTGIVEVSVISAHEISADVREEITGQVRKFYPNAKQIILNEQIDGNVIGGVRLEFPDSQLDLTIRNKLNRFKALTTSERTA
jgi:F0F1-type ATP synthase delta subunit